MRLLGAGAFATGTLLPAIQAVGGFRLVGLATATGASSHRAAEKFGFCFATTDEREVLADPAVDLIAVLTRHDLHARQAAAALAAGKHVFCEKPPALNATELAELMIAHARVPGRLLAVGYNRRFSPMAVKMREHLGGLGAPLLLHCRVNAGRIDPGHWVHDPAAGGGRIVGEGCHFVDLLSYLTDSLPVRVRASGLPEGEGYREDNVVIVLDFADGSVGTITYAAAGDRGLGKERVEAFGGGAAAVLDDYRVLDLHQGGRRRRLRSRLRQDKGHRGEWRALATALRTGGPPPIPVASLAATSLATFAAVHALRTREAEPVDAPAWLRATLGAVPNPT